MTQRTQVKVDPFDRHKLLQEHPLFSALPAEVVNRLRAYTAIKPVRRGTTIFAKGDAGHCLFVVCEGTVKIASPSANGRDAVFNLCHAGAVFGEIALLDGQPRNANAIAVTDCLLMTIDRRDFLPLLRSQPDLATGIINVLCARLRHTSEQVEDLIFLDLPSLLAKTLLHLVDRDPRAGRKVTFTQEEIGEMIGMTRESINKRLRDWQDRDWIRLERSGISILQPKILMAIAEGDRDAD